MKSGHIRQDSNVKIYLRPSIFAYNWTFLREFAGFCTIRPIITLSVKADQASVSCLKGPLRSIFNRFNECFKSIEHHSFRICDQNLSKLFKTKVMNILMQKSRRLTHDIFAAATRKKKEGECGKRRLFALKCS